MLLLVKINFLYAFFRLFNFQGIQHAVALIRMRNWHFLVVKMESFTFWMWRLGNRYCLQSFSVHSKLIQIFLMLLGSCTH